MDELVTSSNNNSILHKLKDNPLFKRLFGSKNVRVALALILFIIGILIVLNVSSTKSTKSNVAASVSATAYTSYKSYTEDVESKLNNILSSIKGAGKTKVMITYDNGPEIKIANSVEEKTTTTGSGSTVTVVTNPILINVNGTDTPLVTMEVVPKVKGVIVVSEGANDIRVRLNMLYAIEALLDCDKDSIQIFVGT